ncbi:unnamed protein product [Nesidiocoris tenuis]|uniref:Uncharacterized protein n=1 Tax=Nesidiocoris tenuis TaxID=355587 RepID=A0A6H5GFC4_9HEMI|nr:unnamed protein product [Nesidiocoris tenuis]
MLKLSIQSTDDAPILLSTTRYFESEDELRLYFDKPIIKDPWLEPPLEFQDTPPPWTRRALTPTPASFLSPGTSASSLSLSLLRTSSSHNSLSVPMAKRADDSSFITSAMSHDVLTDLYNVPIDSDIYTLPIDTIRPRSNHRKRHYRHNGKKRRRHTANPEFHENDQEPPAGCNNKRLSAPANPEPVHMTLQEVRQFLHTLYNGNQNDGRQPQSKRKHKKKAKTIADEKPVKELTNASTNNGNGTKTSLSHILKQTLCNMFRVKKQTTSCLSGVDDKENNNERLLMLGVPKMLPPLQERALPPLPDKTTTSIPTLITKESAIDFASSIEKVKDQHLGPRQITDHEDISATLPSTASYSSGLHPPSERPPRSRLDHSLSDQNQDILRNSFSHLEEKKKINIQQLLEPQELISATRTRYNNNNNNNNSDEVALVFTGR